MLIFQSAPRIMLSRKLVLNDVAILFYLALLKLLLHLLVNGQYGYFRDELAYVDDTKHLDWGYVDHPPLAPFLGSIARFLFGDSLVGFRFFPALASASTLFFVGLIAREFGGGRLAQLTAFLCLFISPVSLLFGVIFQAADFEQLFWVICCYLLVRLLRTDNPKLWPWIGVTIGLSAMNKYSVAFFVAGLVIALVLTPARKYLRSPWLWLGALIALVIFVPNLIWLIQHNFVSLDYTRSINARDVAEGRADGFVLEQFTQVTNAISVPVWLAGLYYVLFKEKRYNLLGYAFLIVFILFLVLRGRSYYLGPFYPVLFAAGGVMLEQWLLRGSRLKYSYLGLLVVGGLIFAPIGLPLLPVGSSLWRSVIKVNDTFSEMIGWQELVGSVATIYQGLPTEERANTAILAGNYGEAGAINMYGPAYNLPKMVSPVNTYYYWSQGNLKANTYIVLGYTPKGLSKLQAVCGDVQQVNTVTNQYDTENEETHYVIYLCRKLKTPLDELWPTLKHYG